MKLSKRSPATTKLLRAARAARDLREGLLGGDWTAVEQVLLRVSEWGGATDVGEVAWREFEVARGELNNRTIIEGATKALGSGAATGGISEINRSSIATSGLLGVLKEAARRGGCTTPQALTLVAAVGLVLEIRQALLSDTPVRLRRALDEAEAMKKELDPLAAEEVAAALDEWNNRETIERTTMALSHGHAEGTVGHLNFAAVDLNQLDEAVAFAEDVGTKTDTARALVDTCKLIRRLRAAEGSGEWDRIAFVLKDVDVAGLALEAAQEEVKAAQMELADHECLDELITALSTGRPAGSTGSLDLASIDVEALDVAIAAAMTLSGDKATSPATAATLERARQIRALRVAVKEGEWQAMQPIIDSIRTTVEMEASDVYNEDEGGDFRGRNSGSIGAGGGEYGGVSSRGMSTLPDIGTESMDMVIMEVLDMQEELDHHLVVTALSEALATGGAIGEGGALDVESIVLDALKVAVALADRLGTVTDMSQRLLRTAKAVHWVRVALRQDLVLERPWDDLSMIRTVGIAGRSMADLISHAASAVVGEEGGPGAVAEEEVNKAQTELNERTLVRLLTKGLAAGGPSGTVGGMETASIDVSQLVQGIKLCAKLGVKSVRTRTLLESAHVVLEMREGERRTHHIIPFIYLYSRTYTYVHPVYIYIHHIHT